MQGKGWLLVFIFIPLGGGGEQPVPLTLVSSNRLYTCQKYLLKSSLLIGCPFIRILSRTWTKCGELRREYTRQVKFSLPKKVPFSRDRHKPGKYSSVCGSWLNHELNHKLLVYKPNWFIQFKALQFLLKGTALNMVWRNPCQKELRGQEQLPSTQLFQSVFFHPFKL